ncbi:DNA cytosine methyltransferase [Nodularia sphaerocarpa]|uniref:DNA cytosine methyltransferase n=1 Tax=Nodularia sphaerocarpa TaxID=137816 RepID=UPI003A95A333
MLKHASLFAGIGGFDLGIKAAGVTDTIQTGLFIENNPDAQRVLKYRFPHIPIHSDIRDYCPKPGEFTLHTIGFPCTGTSAAGNGAGLEHPESKLWFYALRAIAIGKPDFIIVEQPRGIITNGLRAILGGLRVVGYQWDNPQIISCSELGGVHKRERLFVIAYTHNISRRFRELPTGWGEQIRTEVEATHSQRRQTTSSSARVDDGVPSWMGGTSVSGHWRNALSTAPTYPGVHHHLNRRRSCVDLYGRAVTPQQAAIAIKRVCYLAELAGISGNCDNSDNLDNQGNHLTSASRFFGGDSQVF